MRRQMNELELGEFYLRIGAAVWHLQYLEDALVNFLTLKEVHERRCGGQKVNMQEAAAIRREKRKLTLGPLIESCISRKIITSDLRSRFDSFKTERHWLVHRSMIESADDLYLEATRNAVFARIAAIQDEAKALGVIIFQGLQHWVSANGVDLEAADEQGEEALRKLKGTSSNVSGARARGE